MYKYLNTISAFLDSLSSSEYKINKSTHHIIIKYIHISYLQKSSGCSCCTTKQTEAMPAEYSGNNLEINNGNLKYIAIYLRSSLVFQFSEATSLKLIFSSLVMLSTMEDRRRRLEDAEDSLVPSLWFIIAAVEWSAEVDQVSEDFFQRYS